MDINAAPRIFLLLQSSEYIRTDDLVCTQDGFWLVCKSMSEILAQKGILDFPNTDGTRFSCDKFFDDWFLYAVPSENDYVYGLLKLREQEHDAEGDSPADGDTPGVTISFISFSCEILLDCLATPTDENRLRLDSEIDRVVARKGQKHHAELKRYFITPKSEGAYLVADRYARYIASFAENGALDVPDCYGKISRKGKSRLPVFIELLNRGAGRVVCDHEKIYFENAETPTDYERAAILATHTGNTSIYSFAAEVEYHARYLTGLAKIKIPFFKKSIYDSAIRADMTIGDVERIRPASYYRENSKIVQRHYQLHKNYDGVKK